MDVGLHGNAVLDADLRNILREINISIPEQPDDYPDGRDTPVPDERPSPIMSPSNVVKEETRPTVPPSPVSLSPLPPIPPPHQSTSMHQQTKRKKKKKGIAKFWNKLKELFAVFGGDQPPPKLSDKLVPERDDEVRRYGSLFSKLPKPAETGK